MTPHVTLYFWVRDSSCFVIETITVPEDTTIPDLQSQIETKLHLPSYSVHLWTVPEANPVNLSDHCAYAEVLGKLSISELRRFLVTQTVAEIVALHEHRLHIIVDLMTPLPVICYRRGGSTNERFTMYLQRNASFHNVRTEALSHWAEYLGNNEFDLDLYKSSSQGDLEMAQISMKEGEVDHIPVDYEVSCLCDVIPFSEGQIKLVNVIEKVSRAPLAPPPVFRALAEKTVAGARKKWLDDNQEALSPFAAPCASNERQTHSDLAICGRPRSEEDSIPSTLLHPVFGEFVRDTRNAELTEGDYTFAWELADVMTRFYTDEPSHIAAVFETFGDHNIFFFQDSTIGVKPRYQLETDGSMRVGRYHYVLVQVKNEVGASGDPYLQNVRYYLEATRKKAVEMPQSPLPCFLLSIFGPYIVFAAGAWNKRPMVQLLSMPIAFQFHSTDTANLAVVARHMVALRNGIGKLRKYYEDLKPPVPSLTSSPSQLFPYINQYTSRIDKGIKYDIIYQTHPDKNRLVFFGHDRSLSGPRRRICVKFVQRYSAEAHECRTSMGCAPTLLGFESLPAGWFMVVMDDIRDGYQKLTLSRQAISDTVKSLIKDKLENFHKKGFVHGDIRDTNIMVSEIDQNNFKIVDFDWSGEANKVTYPLLINQEDIFKPDGVDSRRLILAEHDLLMLENIEWQVD